MLPPISIAILASLASDPSNALAPVPPAAVVARMQAHYAAAEAELRAHALDRWSPEQRDARERLLVALSAYRERAEFGVNTDFPGARTPYFVDRSGRRCAVAELLHVTGRDDLVADVARDANHAWIADLAHDARFLGWLDANGMELAEAARIQYPGGAVTDTAPGGGGSSGGSSGQGGPAGGSWTGPGDTVPAGGVTGAPSTGPSSPSKPGGGKPSTPGAVSAPSGGGPGSISGGAPSTPTLAMEVDDGWWLWWEYNKSEFAHPNGLAFWRVAATGDDAADAWRKSIASARTDLLATFVKALEDQDSRIRAAAVDAIGKVGRERGVPHVLGRLGDKSTEVRHHAILALGSSGVSDAVPPLLSIMRTGNVEGRAERISPIASAVAIVALGLGRRQGSDEGFDELVDAAVIDRVRGRARSEREPIACAAMLYQRLAPCDALDRVAHELAADEDESPSVRCRAIEALVSSRDPKALSTLQHYLSSSRMDERRSAALALGIVADPLALPALQSAYELETEALTRGFVLTSIGRRGGDDAREFLLKTLAKAEGVQRPWCALALGLAARNDASPAIRKALRDALAKEKSREALGAYWLAFGLARDLEARGLLREALSSGVDARQKMYAATALAFIGDPESAALLRDRLATEESAFLEVVYASALGLLGRPQDARKIAEVMEGLREPGLQGMVAAALAFHGSREALTSLATLAKDDSGSRLRRSAAIEGLSMMLGTTRPYTFGEISRQANYTVFNDWVKGMMQVSL